MPLADAGKGEYLGGSRQPIDRAGLVDGGHSTPRVDLEPFDRRGRIGAQHAAFREPGHVGNGHPALYQAIAALEVGCGRLAGPSVYHWCMSRTNVDVDDEACAAVMRRYRLATKRDAVNFALRSLASEPFSLEEALRMRGAGWDGDLDEMRGRGDDPR